MPRVPRLSPFWYIWGAQGILPPLHNVFTQARHLWSCMRSHACKIYGVGVGPPRTEAESLLGCSFPFAAQLCPSATAGRGVGFIFLDAWVLCVPCFFYHVGLGGWLMSVKDGTTFPDLGRGGVVASRWVSTRACAHVCMLVHAWAHMWLPPCWGQVCRSPVLQGSEGGAAEAWCSCCTGARWLEAGVPHRARG